MCCCLANCHLPVLGGEQFNSPALIQLGLLMQLALGNETLQEWKPEEATNMLGAVAYSKPAGALVTCHHNELVHFSSRTNGCGTGLNSTGSLKLNPADVPSKVAPVLGLR